MLLVAREEAYLLLNSVLVAPTTTRIRDIPTAVVLDPKRDRVPQRCVVSTDNLQAVSKRLQDAPITRLSAERMAEVDRALHFALGLRD